MSRPLIVNNKTFNYPDPGEDVQSIKKPSRAEGLFCCSVCNINKPAYQMSRYQTIPTECKNCREKIKNKKSYEVIKGNKVCPIIKKYKDNLKRKAWYTANIEKIRLTKNNHRKNNPLSRKGENQFRERTIKNQIIARTFKKEIINLYKNCPKNMQVDHIIPVLNKNVCGLHVPWNLQYLNSIDNNRKNNKWDGTYNNEGWKNK